MVNVVDFLFLITPQYIAIYYDELKQYTVDFIFFKVGKTNLN